MKVLLALGALLSVGSLAAWPAIDNNGVVFCYYGSWANERLSRGRFGVGDLPTDLCTHIVYSFLTLNGTTGELLAPIEGTYEEKSNAVADLIALKKVNTDLKILVAIGGWTEGSTNFSAVVNNDTLRATFVSNLYNYVDTNGFDGLDLDWEYPAQRDGAATDKEQFVTLVKELKAAFTSKSYLLTAAVAVTQSNIDLSYNVTELNKYLDYINLMLYDFHGTWDTVTGVNAPLYAQLTDDPSLNLNANNSVNVWINNGASPSKLVLGLGGYGKTFTLTSLNNTSTGAPFSGAGVAGPYLGEAGTWAYYEASPQKLVLGFGGYGKTFKLTSLKATSTGAPFTGAGVVGPYVREAGTWAYYEICEDQKNNASAWNITEVAGNYVYANKDLFWVGYDNPNTIKAKAEYAKTMGLGGLMYWSLDLDDFSGLCGNKYPLISAGITGYNSA